ncbi:histone deacetylase family protein [Guyparkeria sp. SB14A]|uniref:histone deacetylase family protein n=1 Tax=Guyparkeria sp. SB14A TaxID=2571147 RepID=UPI0010ACE1CB|nr:histone deacetylase family protein [Guyparkeria sp. SB14A]TKA91126.1 histone deacetylase family protein [Guyparkeria sp. SB14A]
MLIYSHPVCWKHVNENDVMLPHPERPERLDAVMAAIDRFPADRHTRVEAPLGDKSDYELAHDPRYVEAIFSQAPTAGDFQALRVDGDTSLNEYTIEASRRVVGAAKAAVDAVLPGPERRAFLATRPPGHHAGPCQPRGFCVFNNVSIAAYYAIRHHGLERVAIVDFDVHHGDGTEEIVANSDAVRFFSIFQHPYYPYAGIPPIADNCFPIGLPNMTDGKAFRKGVRDSVWFETLREFRPQLLLFSAGFDAHKNDPLGGWILEDEDFAWITREVIAAAGGADLPVVSLLEGGYDLEGLEDSVLAHLKALDGDAG